MSRWLQTEPPVENIQIYKNSNGGIVGHISHVAHSPTLPHSWIYLPWRWRRYVPPKRQFTQDVHGATPRRRISCHTRNWITVPQLSNPLTVAICNDRFYLQYMNIKGSGVLKVAKNAFGKCVTPFCSLNFIFSLTLYSFETVCEEF
jgi:hypothetical protein